MKRMMVMMMVSACLACPIFLSAAGQQESDAVELTVMVNFQATEAVSTAFEEVIDKFHASQDEIKINFITGTSDYEALMKSKMATNDLPDIWSTHGWSVLRYSEYLQPLNDQEWVMRLHPAILPVVSDKEDNIYVLPLDVDMAGIAYNKSVCEEAGVDVREIKSWDDLFAAMEKVKTLGLAPVHLAGKDNWTIGNFFDWLAPSLYVTDENNYRGNELLKGEFDTDAWTIAAGLLKKMHENGYLNVDCLTAGYSEAARALAVGDCAFTFYGNYVLAEAWTYNEDADLGFFPVPAYYEGDQPSLITGERTALGIWKESEYQEEAKRFLDFLAKPENAARIASANAIPAGLIDAESDTGRLADDYAMWAKSSSFPYFDRAFLPGGMWDTMCSTGTGILSGDMSPEDAAAKMQEDFQRLYK